MQTGYKWPYQSEIDSIEEMEADVLVLGGGIAGCMAAIEAAKKGKKVIVVEKAAVKRSGAGGSGSDHWEMAATNPCSNLTPEELVEAMMDDNDGFNNAISHYIECREGWDRLVDIEKMGGKIRDTDDEFAGAEFRDEKTKLMFAYDYKNRITLRIWGTTFKPAMEKEMKRLGVSVVNHVAVTSLLTEGGRNGSRCIGATGVNGRTGKFHVFSGKSVVMAMSRPARIWLFSAGYPGLCEFRPMSCIGNGHAMGWRIGAEFNMMEKSVKAQFSASGKSYPPYSAGNNHNTWYAASLIDAEGKEIPYANRDGKILENIMDRYNPSEGQKFFMMGGNIEKAKYAYEGPETICYKDLENKGYKLPFYADLTTLPDHERNVIWGMMIAEEGKTKIPVHQYYTKQGFDSSKHVVQCYGNGWTSASFLPQERQLFGLPGGFMNDWKLQSNIAGLFVAGDALFASNCFGHAAATGGYAGRHAADYADNNNLEKLCEAQIETERKRVFAPLYSDLDSGITWKELNQAIAKVMQNYCGEVKEETLLKTGLSILKEYESKIVPKAVAANPHELVRLLEVIDILTVSQIIIEASIHRKNNCEKLEFIRSDSLAEEYEPFIAIKNDGNNVISRKIDLNYAGDVKENYEAHNGAYIKEMRH